MQDVIAGRYELAGELGRGGMAQVRAARDLRLHRTVAVKLLHPAAAPDAIARQRFVREARAAAAFSHPHAVAVYDAGDADGFLYLVMELVDGRSLATVLATDGPLSPPDAVRITDEVLQALGAAHRAGIVHRDVKPGNVIVAGNGSAKLADFGIAKRAGDGELTLAGQFIGTPQYLAPEQVAGEPVTPATDLYATGVVLFEALTGRPPFDAGTPLATALAHRDAPVPDVRSVRPDVPDHIAVAVARAMAKDPSRRFSSADEMRAALARAPARIPPVMAPPTEVMPVPPSRARQWWWVLAVAVALGVAGVVIAVDSGDDPGVAPAVTTAAAAQPAATTAPPTAPPTTVTTTVPPTQPPAPAAAAPATVEELIALVDAEPQRFGERGDDVRRDLERIAERGRQRDVERLLEDTAEWRDEGSLPAETAALIEAVLAQVPTVSEGEDDD